jgi:hypothetical protein
MPHTAYKNIFIHVCVRVCVCVRACVRAYVSVCSLTVGLQSSWTLDIAVNELKIIIAHSKRSRPVFRAADAGSGSSDIGLQNFENISNTHRITFTYLLVYNAQDYHTRQCFTTLSLVGIRFHVKQTYVIAQISIVYDRHTRKFLCSN